MAEPSASGPRAALLLLGPTGAGKTPLGRRLDTQGWRGRRCVHLDFGAELRRVCAAAPVPGLDAAAQAAVRHAVENRALLENEQFHLAERIIAGIIGRHAMGPDDLLVLNGIPRHVGQARDMERIARVEEVVELRCTPEVVQARIRSNVGGDRHGRADDNAADVTAKLALYAARTEPLIEYYRRRNVPVRPIEVTVDMNPQQLWSCLAAG